MVIHHPYLLTDMASLLASIGGVFLYSADPVALAKWYQEHLQLTFDFQTEGKHYGKAFAYIPLGEDLAQSAIVWSIGKLEDDMVGTGRQRATVNYRVHDMAAVKAHFESLGTALEPKHYPGEGYFAHVHDPDGNKLELWQDQFVYEDHIKV